MRPLQALMATAALAAAPLWAAPPAAPAAKASAARSAPGAVLSEAERITHGSALKRLEAQLREQIDWRPRSRDPLRWQEAVIPPETQRLAWGPRPVRVSEEGPSWRFALDLRTRWYYVAQAAPGKPVRYYGPLHELPDGRFADVGLDAAPQPPAGYARRRPATAVTASAPAAPAASVPTRVSSAVGEPGEMPDVPDVPAGSTAPTGGR